MIDSFNFILPTEIQFGMGVVNSIAADIKNRGFRNPLIITDKGVVGTGLIDIITKQFDTENLKYNVFDNVYPNPKDYDCDKVSEYAIQKGSDVIIAVGGGSVMDTAKAVAIIMTNGKTTKDWFDVELDIQSAPVITIPTTCGTGSEVTYNAVITDTDIHLKANIFDPKCAPILAIVDPQFIINLPKKLIASTGMDALTHAIEAYVCTLANPITDAIAIRAVELIAANIVKATREKDCEALANVMLASMMAGIAFGNADTAGVHCIAECFGGFYDIPHGVTNAIFLADVSEFSIPGNVRKYAEIAKAMGIDSKDMDDEKTALEGIKKIRKLSSILGIPKLASFEGVNPADFKFLADASSKHCCNPHNPIEATAEDYFQIISKVYYDKEVQI